MLDELRAKRMAQLQEEYKVENNFKLIVTVENSYISEHIYQL